MKLKHTIASLAAVAILGGFTISVLAGDEKEEIVTMDQVPQKVKDTLKNYAAESDVKKIEKGEDDDQKVYEFAIEQGTHKFEVSITKKGKYWGQEEDMDLAAMPDAAQKALTAQAAGGTISGTEKATDKDNKVTYEADITATNGKKSEVAVDADGKVISTEAAGAEKD